MTTTIVMGRTDDGYVVASGASFNAARFGAAGSVGVGNLSYWGQRLIGSTYEIRQAAIGFTFTAVPATELVTSAVVQLVHGSQNSPARPRNALLKANNWTPGGLTTADYVTAGGLQADPTWATILDGQSVGAKTTYMGGDRLVAHLEGGATSANFALVSRTNEDGAPAPIGDELATFWSGNSAGTTNDPRLVYTTVQRHSLVPVLGASVTLSDGTQVSLRSGPLTLVHGTWSAALPADFYPDVAGAQGFALTVDDQDNVYVVGRSTAADNSVAVRVYLKNPAADGFSGTGPVRTAAMPGFVSQINNVAAAWHPVAQGTLVVVAAHTAGDAVTGPSGNDMAYVILSSTALRTGATATRAVGSAVGLFVAARVSPASTVYNTSANETGTGLDMVADPVQGEAGYVFSFNKGVRLGENGPHYIGRYTLASTGFSFSHTSTQAEEGWATKDAGAKLRVVSIGAGQVAAVSADAETGYGLTVNVWQTGGASSGYVQLGQVLMDQEGITGFPTPSDLAMSSAWDAVYSSLENKLWIYYVGTGTSVVRRTSIDLNTYQATGVVENVHDYTSAQTVVSIRLPRGRWATTRTWMDVALKAVSGGAYTLDTRASTFNVAPLAPTLTPKDNYDATVATVFAWTFNDTPGDTQSAYQFQVVDVADGSVDIDTGKTVSATASRNVAGSTLANSKSYRWRVKTWDALDVEGPWSDYGTFSTTSAGAVTVTDPAVDNQGGVETDDYLLKWSVAGTVQASYRVIVVRVDTGATSSDTGWIAGTATQLLISGMLSDVEYRVDVQVRNAALVPSGIGSRRITPSYAVPEVPLVQVLPLPDEGYVLVQVDNPIPGQPANSAVEYDFEGDALGATPASWAVNDGTLVASNTVAHKGSQSAKMTTTGTPSSTYARAGSFGVVPGTRYTCRVWVYVPVSVKVQASIDWRLSGGSYFSSSNGPEVMVPATTWTLLSISAEAPGGVAEAGYGPTLPSNPPTGSIVYFDEVSLPEASDRPDVSRNLVLRRPVGSDAWELVGECGPDGSFRDYRCPAWVPVQYMVRGEV